MACSIRALSYVVMYHIACFLLPLLQVTNSPDYRSMPVEVALADLTKRIAEYEKVYQTLDEGVEDATSPLGECFKSATGIYYERNGALLPLTRIEHLPSDSVDSTCLPLCRPHLLHQADGFAVQGGVQAHFRSHGIHHRLVSDGHSHRPTAHLVGSGRPVHG